MLTNALRLALLTVSVWINPAVEAATLIVTTNADDGAGSLRQAIVNATDGDTINFASDMTITLTTGELLIGKNLTIDGVGHAVTVSGNTASGVLHPVTKPVILRNLTIIGGNATYGGGLFNGSSVTTLINVTFSGNTGESGGAINNHGTLMGTNVTVSGNSATNNGGGIYNLGTLMLTNTTLAGNTVGESSRGGGIYNGSGAGLQLTNVTLFNNSASEGGGVYNVDTQIGLTNVTLSGNSGGGVYSIAASALLTNILLAGNTPGGNCNGSINNVANNLDDGATCGFGSTNGSLSNTNPLLGTLGNHGGATQTIPLLAGSPAINAGTNTGCPATDQRGVKRPQEVICDIGAYEWVNPLGGAWNNDWQILRQP